MPRRFPSLAVFTQPTPIDSSHVQESDALPEMNRWLLCHQGSMVHNRLSLTGAAASKLDGGHRLSLVITPDIPRFLPLAQWPIRHKSTLGG